jgi:hypothetical protein
MLVLQGRMTVGDIRNYDEICTVHNSCQKRFGSESARSCNHCKAEKQKLSLLGDLVGVAGFLERGTFRGLSQVSGCRWRIQEVARPVGVGAKLFAGAGLVCAVRGSSSLDAVRSITAEMGGTMHAAHFHAAMSLRESWALVALILARSSWSLTSGE